MTDTARHRRELFVAALDLPDPERAAFLRRECPDPALRAEILELLAIEPPQGFLAPPDLVRDSQLPRMFGAYEVDRGTDLGPGRLLARHASTGKVVEIETQPLPSAADADRVTAFVRTAHRMGQLRHRGCVPVHEHGRLATEFWFARDHVDGHDLACELERQGRTDDTAAAATVLLPRIGSHEWLQALLAVFEMAVDAVCEAHRIGIAHGDLDARRILLDRQGRGYVVGFGVAGLLGRPASPSLDMASISALLHGALVATLARPVANGHSQPVSAAERANVRALLRRLDPAARWPYVDAAALLADLGRLRSGQPLLSHSWSERLVGWFAHRRPHRSAD